MAVTVIHVDNRSARAGIARLNQRIARSTEMRDEVAMLHASGVCPIEFVKTPGQPNVLIAQLSDPYWVLLEKEAI